MGNSNKKQDVESSNILGFVRNVTEKNYAEANKYLRAAVEDKMKNKITAAVNKTQF